MELLKLRWLCCAPLFNIDTVEQEILCVKILRSVTLIFVSILIIRRLGWSTGLSWNIISDRVIRGIHNMTSRHVRLLISKADITYLDI